MFSKIVKGILIFIFSIILLMIHWIAFLAFAFFMIWRSAVNRKKLLAAEQEAQKNVKEYSTEFDVTEVTDDNEDGKNRQEVLMRCYRGDLITFKHIASENKPPIIEAWTQFGMIGYLDPYGVIKHAEFFESRNTSEGIITILTEVKMGGPIGCKVVIDLTKQQEVQV